MIKYAVGLYAIENAHQIVKGSDQSAMNRHAFNDRIQSQSEAQNMQDITQRATIDSQFVINSSRLRHIDEQKSV